MSNQNTVSIQFKKDEIFKVEGILKASNWLHEEVSNNPYVCFKVRSPKGSVATMYTSGKLVFQGKEDFTTIIASLKGQEEDASIVDFLPHIGVDEVGKGDYFGPLVVVSCFVNTQFLEKITYLGFTDSKKITDKKIVDLFNMIREYPYYYVSIVEPTEYNKLILDYKNASILLAKQHSIVIEKALIDLKEKGIDCTRVVVDQFSSKKERILDELGELGRCVELEQFHKGESDIAVAAASIIARGVFLEEWEKMCKKYNFKFPKGSSNVLGEAKQFVSEYGVEELSNVAKVGFKTTKQVLTLF